jgi:DNA polymerase
MALLIGVNFLIRTKNGMTASYQSKDELLSALKWQADIGIDCALSDTAIGLYASETPPMPTPSATSISTHLAQKTPPKTHQATLSTSDSADNLASLSNSFDKGTSVDFDALTTLEDLKSALQAFDGCALKKTASNLVFADGNPAADIMLIGEAPGRDEDRMGLPFVGAAGQLLDRMLKSIGMDRQNVYITNILPWRPPGNRTPSPEETQLLWPFLRRHIQLKAPKIIFALGGSSAKLLLNTQTGILKLRGQMQKIDFSDAGNGSLPIPVLPSLHPAYLLRAPNMKKQAFLDLLQLQKYNK